MSIAEVAPTKNTSDKVGLKCFGKDLTNFVFSLRCPRAMFKIKKTYSSAGDIFITTKIINTQFVDASVTANSHVFKNYAAVVYIYIYNTCVHSIFQNFIFINIM